MLSQPLLLFLSLGLPLTQAAETILGAYIFHRHGDRTDKSHPPANLTDLGYREVYTSGQYFRDRYVSSSASAKIAGLNSDLVKNSQLTVSAPSDTVLMNSAQGFLQGLYPPVGSTLGTQTLRNGTTVEAPLNGYQLIPISQVQGGSGSENSAWLQGSTNCAKAEASSNEYFSTPDYLKMLNETQSFYTSLTPMINATFTADEINFKNAYTIFDLLYVASIHNQTIPAQNLLTNETLFQARTLADHHEYNLAFNSTAPIRAVGGATLAAQIVSQLNTTITGQGKSKLGIQFGAYGSFQSFFGLANLTSTNPDFFGVPDYASSMIFELYTNSSATPFPDASEINVRFLFHNGTTSNTSEPAVYPLFGQQETSLTWQDFAEGMGKFSIGTQQAWCSACGNTTGSCAPSSTSTSGSASATATSSTHHGSHLSNAVAGVIGAMVTLGVIFGLEAIIMLLGGLRLVTKNRLRAPATAGQGDTIVGKA
ncbi:MAG: hypothetical protein M1819_000485 [Sarea resinae]|nr:MAG: hypothetical protein M1819_000485 [Sarea resinae]